MILRIDLGKAHRPGHILGVAGEAERSGVRQLRGYRARVGRMRGQGTVAGLTIHPLMSAPHPQFGYVGVTLLAGGPTREGRRPCPVVGEGSLAVVAVLAEAPRHRERPEGQEGAQAHDQEDRHPEVMFAVFEQPRHAGPLSATRGPRQISRESDRVPFNRKDAPRSRVNA